MATKIFISYAHADSRWLKEALTHLKPFVSAKQLEVWNDTGILVGNDWKAEIENALQEADIGLLLVSPEFLASDFIMAVELPAFAEKRIFWVPVSASSFESTSLSKLQAALDPRTPLDGMTRSKRNQAWVTIFKKLQQNLANPR